MNRKWLVGVVAVVVVVFLLRSYKREVPKKIVAEPAKFSVDYPEPLSISEREKQAAQVIEAVIYGRMVDPEGAAQRLEHFRSTIKKAAAKYQVPADLLAALIFLESGADAYAMSGAQAAGIAQMIGPTAKKYGLLVGPKRTKDLMAKRRVAKRQLKLVLSDPTQRKRVTSRIADIERKLRLADERFNPNKAIPAAARYLSDHYQTFGRWDFAFAAYHAGSGNIQRVVGDYITGWMWAGSAKTTIARQKLSWSKVFFDATPSRHPNTHGRLWSLNDDSRTYWFRILAAENVLHLWQQDRKKFRVKVKRFKAPGAPRRWELAIEPAWYPPGSMTVSQWPAWQDLANAYESGQLVQLPDDPDRFGFGVSDDIGLIASPDARPYYRGLAPEAAGLLVYLGSAVRRESKRTDASLQITSLVRSMALQRRFFRAGLSPSEYSTHCGGLAFDIAPPKDQSVHRALRYVLDDLRLRGDICYAHERSGRAGDHYHVTLAPASQLKFSVVWQLANQHWLVAMAHEQPKSIVDRPHHGNPVLVVIICWLAGVGAIGIYLGSKPRFRRWPAGLAIASVLWPMTVWILAFSPLERNRT